MCEPVLRVEIYIDCSHPFRLRHAVDASRRSSDAGVIHQHIQATKRSLLQIEDGFDLGRVDNVSLCRGDSRNALADLRNGVAIDIADMDLCPGFSERRRY